MVKINFSGSYNKHAAVVVHRRGMGGESAPQVPASREILGESSITKDQIHDVLIRKSVFCLSLDFLL